MVDHVLRHRSASAYLDNIWELDESDGRILAAIRIAPTSRLVHVALEVCHPVAPRAPGRFACWPVDGSAESWRIERGVYDAGLPPPHPVLPAVSLLLLNTPPRLASALGRRLRV